MPHLEQYDRIRARVAAEGFTPDLQTRITLFVCASKAVNMPFLAMASAAPANTLLWQATNSQLFRESEAMALLMRVTRWALGPQAYMASAQLAAPLYAEAARAGFTGWPMTAERAGLDAMAFGHALLATIRLTPILPQTNMALAPYAVALMRIEQENGRLLQTQIRMLKDGFADISEERRETAIARKAEVVEAAFDTFLSSLAD